MRWSIRVVGGSLLPVALLGAVASICGDGASDRETAPAGGASATAARATVEAAATAGLLPGGLVISTPTPDTHPLNKLTPEATRDRLAQEPTLVPLFRALDQRDVDALLDEFDWHAIGCGGRLTPACAPEVERGTQLAAISAGTESWATRDNARSALGPLLRAMDSSIPAFVAQSQSEPERYWLGFEAATQVANAVVGRRPIDHDRRHAARD